MPPCRRWQPIPVQGMACPNPYSLGAAGRHPSRVCSKAIVPGRGGGPVLGMAPEPSRRSELLDGIPLGTVHEYPAGEGGSHGLYTREGRTLSCSCRAGTPTPAFRCVLGVWWRDPLELRWVGVSWLLTPSATLVVGRHSGSGYGFGQASHPSPSAWDEHRGSNRIRPSH